MLPAWYLYLDGLAVLRTSLPRPRAAVALRVAAIPRHDAAKQGGRGEGGGRDSRVENNTSYERGREQPPHAAAAAARRQAHFRVIVQPRAGIFATQTRVTRPSTFDSQVPHWPSSQLNLIGARAARTTSFMRCPGMAWTVLLPIFTATVFFCVERPLPAFGFLSKDSFLKACV